MITLSNRGDCREEGPLFVLVIVMLVLLFLVLLVVARCGIGLEAQPH